MVDEKTKLKDWYMKEFPEDELGSQIPDQFTFYDLFRCLDTYCDPYSLMGDSADSIMRERLFAELAEVMDVDYDYIYDQWLKTTDRPYVINEAEESTVDADKINLDNIVAQLKDSGITNERTLDLMSKDVLKDLKNNYAKDCQSDGTYYGVVISDAIRNKIAQITGSMPSMTFNKKNESEKLTESSSIKSVEPNYTGGNIYVYTGELNDGTYFMTSDDWTDNQNNFYNVLIVNEDPNSKENEEDSWYEDWQQSHLVKSLEAKEATNFFKDMLTWVIKNKPEGNYQVADIEDILDDMKSNVNESDEEDEDAPYVDPNYEVDLSDVYLTNGGYHNNESSAYGTVKLIPKKDNLKSATYKVFYMFVNDDVMFFEPDFNVGSAVNSLYNAEDEESVMSFDLEDNTISIPQDQKEAIERTIRDAYYNDNAEPLNKVNYD